MALFGKKKKSEKPAPETAEQQTSEEKTPEVKPREVKRAALTSGRMAKLYQQMFQWIFSVNVTADAYQIESGEDSFGMDALPIRGYYHDLLEKLRERILPAQQEDFLTLLNAENIGRAMEKGKTGLCGAFCAKKLGMVSSEEDAEELKWYEFRVEWLQEVDLKNRICVLSLRHINGDLDSGRPVKTTAAVLNDAGDIDWEATRIQRLNFSSEGMDFEYDVANDCLYLHRMRGNSEGDRTTQRFVSTLASHGDFLVSHESVKDLKQLLRSEPRSGVEQAEILFRKDGTFGAPFRHYRVVAAALEDEGTPTWIVGRMDDIEKEALLREGNQEIARELGNMLKNSRISMYQLNITQNLIFPIVQDEKGFHREEKPQRLSEYFQKRIASDRISPEAKEEYLKWLENGYLQRKTAQGTYEFEAKVKEIGDVDFRWYQETIIPIKGRAGQFMRWRRDDTEGHQAREIEYKNIELGHIAEYNGQMLDSLASLVEFRNVESSSHIANVRLLTRILLEDLHKRSTQYEISKKKIDTYVQAATMHDIGKITVPDYILNKQGKLTPEEFTIMKRHTTDGAIIVDRLNMPGQDELKACIRDVALHHHERYDGGGYPDGLVGDAIDIGVQVISLADVYDALVSERCYKKGYVVEEALHMILDGECGVFNPALIESLKVCYRQMSALYENKEN